MSTNEEQMQFAKHTELIRVTTRWGWSHSPLSRHPGRGHKADGKLQVGPTVFLKACSVWHLHQNRLRSLLKYACLRLPPGLLRPSVGVGPGEPPCLTRPPGDCCASSSLTIPLGRKGRQEYFRLFTGKSSELGISLALHADCCCLAG